jgi:hypothetical protein
MRAVLGDAPVVARRTDSLLVIRPEGSQPGAPEPGDGTASNKKPGSKSPAPDAPGRAEGEDPGPRMTFGGDAEVAAGERASEVITFGGDALVAGEVLEDVVSMGGDVRVRRGGVVGGDVVTMGGDLHLEPGGEVRGDPVTMGGTVMRHEGEGDARDGSDGSSAAVVQGASDDGAHQGWLSDALGSVTRHALLLLLGLLLLGLMPRRLQTWQAAVAGSPLRSGAVGLLTFLVAIVLCLVLVVTLIGIPAAILLALMIPLAAYVGLAVTAGVVGAAMPFSALRERPVLQLTVGVGLLLVVSWIPVVGTLVTLVAMLLGTGALVVTRLGRTQR